MTHTRVKSVQGDGHWDGQYGRMYSFEYQMEDGTTLKANHKTETPPFKPGDEVEYEITKTNDYGKLGKVKKYNPEWETKKGSYDDHTIGIKVGHAINNAVRILAATSGSFQEDDIKRGARFILGISKDLESEFKSVPKEEPKPERKVLELEPETDGDDFPF